HVPLPTAPGPAHLACQTSTSAAATVTVIYHYTPSNDLRPGPYTIVQPNQPAGYLDGLETSGNVTPIPGTVGTDFININLASVTSVSSNNCFGEAKPSDLAGYVYVDATTDGVKQLAETAIQGVTVPLTGSNDLAPVNLSAVTDASGLYRFLNLRPGTYTITETQPAAYLDGKDTVGTPGGTLG